MIILGMILLSGVVVAFLSAIFKIQSTSLKFFPLVTRNFLATLTVPLFLGISDSSLLDTIIVNGVFNAASYLKLLGLLIIAAVYSDTFLAQVSEKVIAGLKATEFKLEKQEEKLVEQGSAIDETKRLLISSEIVTTDQEHIPKLIEQFKKQDEEIICLLDPEISSKYQTVSQLAKKGFEEKEIHESLLRLKELDLVDEIEKHNAWYLTANGKEIINFMEEGLNA